MAAGKYFSFSTDSLTLQTLLMRPLLPLLSARKSGSLFSLFSPSTTIPSSMLPTTPHFLSICYSLPPGVETRTAEAVLTSEYISREKMAFSILFSLSFLIMNNISHYRQYFIGFVACYCAQS